MRQSWGCCRSKCVWGLRIYCLCFDPVVRNPPGWEVGIYLVGFLVLLGAAGVNIWKLWKSGTFPAPSPFPNFDYRYLQEKYGTSFSEVRQKVSLRAQDMKLKCHFLQLVCIELLMKKSLGLVLDCPFITWSGICLTWSVIVILYLLTGV